MTELRTHRGHTVEVLEGNAQGIIDRGTEIEDLGEQMIGAADILREVGDGASEERVARSRRSAPRWATPTRSSARPETATSRPAG